MDRSRTARVIVLPVALLAAIIVAAGCASTTPPRQVRQVALPDTARLPIAIRPTDSAGISGIVNDPRGKPVPWVHVALFGTHVEALGDAHGRFAMKLAPGSYALWTKRIGYHARLDTIQVPRDGGVYVKIPLREYAFWLDASCHRLPSGGSIC